MGCSDNKIYNFTKTHGLIKTQQMITASQKNLLLDKYGCDNVMKVDCIKNKCKEKLQHTFKQNKQQIIKKKEFKLVIKSINVIIQVKMI